MIFEPLESRRHLSANSIELHTNFRQGAQGWAAGFADLPPNSAQSFELDSGIRAMPANLHVGGTGKGFFITGNNHSDDLFMFLKKRLTKTDGIKPNQNYRVAFDIAFASNAASNSIGIGGAPGKSVFLKTGGSKVEPRPVLKNGQLQMNIDKGFQANRGSNASVAGDIANGTDADDFVLIRRRHVHTGTVRSDSRGRLWLMVGTDSGFEGITPLFYQHINVALTAVPR